MIGVTSMSKFLVARVFADDGVGTDDHDVKVMALMVTADDITRWLGHMERVEQLKAQPEFKGLAQLVFNSRAVFYAFDEDGDDDCEVESFLDPVENAGYVVLDELPDWWDLRALEVPTDRDHLHIGATVMMFSAIEHYGVNYVTAGTMLKDELKSILDGFQTVTT